MGRTMEEGKEALRQQIRPLFEEANKLANTIETVKAMKLALPLQSVLSDDLVTMVMEYAMYDHDAKKILTKEHGLHRYHSGKFMHFDGVEVTGAGCAQANGLYRRREAPDGPPATHYLMGPRGPMTDCPLYTPAQWLDVTKGHPWYQNDNSYYIFHHQTGAGNCASQAANCTQYSAKAPCRLTADGLMNTVTLIRC